MPKQTIEAFFPRSPGQIWRVVTDPTMWEWPGGPAWVCETRGGRKIIAEDLDGSSSFFRVTAFAPPLWYAVDVSNRKVEGRCEALLFPEGRGTRVEFTADLRGKSALWKLLLRFRLELWQREYIESIRKIMRIM